jgi:hypothetical protein
VQFFAFASNLHAARELMGGVRSHGKSHMHDRALPNRHELGARAIDDR